MFYYLVILNYKFYNDQQSLQDEAGLCNDLSFLAHLPELCDITFMVCHRHHHTDRHDDHHHDVEDVDHHHDVDDFYRWVLTRNWCVLFGQSLLQGGFFFKWNFQYAKSD